jgi:hypothetical protein
MNGMVTSFPFLISSNSNTRADVPALRGVSCIPPQAVVRGIRFVDIYFGAPASLHSMQFSIFKVLFLFFSFLFFFFGT